MDDITNKRFADIEKRIDGLEERVGDRFDKLSADIQITRDDLRAHMTAVEMRLSTAIMGLAGAIADVKAFMVERDQTQARLARIEEKLGIVSKQ